MFQVLGLESDDEVYYLLFPVFSAVFVIMNGTRGEEKENSQTYPP